MKLILMRHTEVDFSPDRFLGRNDVSLSMKGVRHARKLAERLRGERIGAIYSSGLKRTIETAEIISKALDIDFKGKIADINEVDFGVIEGLTRKEAEKRHPELMQMRDNDRMNFRIPEGESCNDTGKRALAAVKKIIKDNRGRNVLVVTHCMVMRILLSKITGKPLKDTYKKRFGYGCRLVFEAGPDRIAFKMFVDE